MKREELGFDGGKSSSRVAGENEIVNVDEDEDGAFLSDEEARIS